MLDTNIVSDLMRNPSGPAAIRLAAHGPARVGLSIFTAAELTFGAQKAKSPKFAERVTAILARFPILPFASPGEEHYGAIRAFLSARGTPIGPNDLWIAAHALTLGVTLITHNLTEFQRVPGLAVESWLD